MDHNRLTYWVFASEKVTLSKHSWAKNIQDLYMWINWYDQKWQNKQLVNLKVAKRKLMEDWKMQMKDYSKLNTYVNVKTE